jgi:hypothetical protein
MTNQWKWLWIGGVVAAAVAALALGVLPGTVLLVALVLLCPAAMYFGMHGHGHEGRPGTSDLPDEGRETGERERPTSPNQVRR